MNKNKAEIKSISDWIVTKSLDDEQILEYGKDILSKPSCTITTGELHTENEPMYSQNQMVDMFKVGYSVATEDNTTYTIQKKKPSKRIDKPYSLIRKLGIGDTVSFPFDEWASVRTAASTIKRQFGTTFNVRKLAPKNMEGRIEVTRLA